MQNWYESSRKLEKESSDRAGLRFGLVVLLEQNRVVCLLCCSPLFLSLPFSLFLVSLTLSFVFSSRTSVHEMAYQMSMGSVPSAERLVWLSRLHLAVVLKYVGLWSSAFTSLCMVGLALILVRTSCCVWGSAGNSQ